MVQYYTLEEAARILQMTSDKLKEMVRQNKIRAFQDRGTLRFRAQEIDELARSMGLGSDPEVQLGEAGPKSSGPSSRSRRKSKMSPPPDEDSGLLGINDFTLPPDDEVPLGQNPPSGADKATPRSSVGKRKTSAPRPSKLGPQPPRQSKLGKEPIKPADSDVRLVSDSGLDFQVDDPARPADSNPKAASRKSLMGKPDSDVKLEKSSETSESHIPIVTGGKKASDSDIRLDQGELLPSFDDDHDPLITEEIDLDLEAMKADQRSGPASSKGNAPVLPTTSPFELSEADLGMDESSDGGIAPIGGKTDSSEEFELTAFDEKPLKDPSSGDQIPLLSEDDNEVSLGELTGGAGASGINLSPADSGISLEQGGSDELEFDENLSLDAGATPVPKSGASAAETENSEFELSMGDEGEADVDEMGVDSSSEFELTLDEESGSSEVQNVDSDSEFELTLDDGAGLAPLEETSSLAEESQEVNLDETDFEVPALDDDSGSEALALDESSSEFELTVDDSEIGVEESGSEVVTLEEDEGVAVDIEEEPVLDDLGVGDGLDIEIDAAAEEEEEEEEVAYAPQAPPAEWGVLPALFMAPAVIILFLVGLMSFEMIQSMWGYNRGARTSRLIVDPIARMFDFNNEMPKD